MKKYTHEETLRISEQFIASEYWDWYKQKLGKQISLLEPNIFTTVDKESDRIFKDGILAGIRWCLETPEREKRSNDNFINKWNLMLNKVTGV